MVKGLKLDPEDKELKNLESLKKGEKRSVFVGGMASPVCVGVVLKTVEELRKDFSGKILKITHYLGDSLWSTGDQIPPSKIEKKMVETKQENKQEETEGKQTNEKEEKVNEKIENSQKFHENENENQENKEINLKNENLKEIEASPLDPREEMDQLVFSCFMNALKAKLYLKKDLPLLLSTFYAKYMVPCCPENKKLNLKHSSYKKLPVFINHMQEKG